MNAIPSSVPEKLEEHSLMVEDLQVFHGSVREGLEELLGAEDYTYGTGLYTTTSQESAEAYALKRTIERIQEIGDPTPSVYELSITGNFFDARAMEAQEAIFREFGLYLLNQIQRMETVEIGLVRYVQNAISENPKGKLVPSFLGGEFSKFMQSLGYTGIIALEQEMDLVPTGIHDTYVVFDPGDAKLVKETSLQQKYHGLAVSDSDIIQHLQLAAK